MHSLYVLSLLEVQNLSVWAAKTDDLWIFVEYVDVDDEDSATSQANPDTANVGRLHDFCLM
jgi:hypothetical protein